MSRHTWARIAEHKYLCTRCGSFRENVYDEVGGGWTQLWHLPDGSRDVRSRVAPCAAGPRTMARLQLWDDRGRPDIRKRSDAAHQA